MGEINNRIGDKIKNNGVYKEGSENIPLVVILMVLITLVTYSYFSQGLIYDMVNQDLDDVISFIGSFGKLSWLIYVLMVIIEVVVVPIPSLILNAAAGISFGSLTASLLTLTGITIGTVIAYNIAKRYASSYFIRLIGEERKQEFYKYADKHGALFIFMLRINPITSSDIFSYVAGMMGIPFKKFFISTMLGIIPGIILVSFFGELIIKKVPLFKLLFIIITLGYGVVFIYLAIKYSKNKVKDKFLKK